MRNPPTRPITHHQPLREPHLRKKLRVLILSQIAYRPDRDFAPAKDKVGKDAIGRPLAGDAAVIERGGRGADNCIGGASGVVVDSLDGVAAVGGGDDIGTGVGSVDCYYWGDGG